MINAILNADWTMPLLLILTGVLVFNDRVFQKTTRRAFYLALCFGFILSIGSRYGSLTKPMPFLSLNSIVRPLLLLALIWAMDQKRSNGIKLCMGIPAIINAVLVLFNIQNHWLFSISEDGSVHLGKLAAIPAIVFVVYGLYIVYRALKDAQKEDGSEHALIVICILMIAYAVAAEILVQNRYVIGETLNLIVCIYYFCKVMLTYKRDALTKLALRHNLNFELKDLHNFSYIVSLIDVDNFKMINDKYGHEKGDEVLVTVVETVKEHLLKRCRMYRYGGDEFVILSRKATKEEITQMFEDINKELKNKDLRISYGVIEHAPGQDSKECLVAADEAMYENKRMIKSENIWDDMTGLYNYRGFKDELDTIRKKIRGKEKKICLVCTDVEHLGNINMGYGYTEGNMIISALARVLKSTLKGKEFIGHLGSDEFCVALEFSDEKENVSAAFIQKVMKNIDKAYEFAGKEYTVELNFGVYVIEENELSEDAINHVLYRKQQEKYNRRKLDIIDGSEDYDKEEEAMVIELLQAKKFRYAFQPIVSAKDGQIVAYEALMRAAGEIMVSPVKILQYATKNNLVYEVEKSTFYNVLETVSRSNIFEKNRRVFINSIPGYSLSDADYKYLKGKYGDVFPHLVVEITEQRELEDTDLDELLRRRNECGFNLAIDDFGSGCSNTNSLLRYMPQVVKLDRLLIADIDKNSKKQFFVNSIITFAKENNMLVLAEGVETIEELRKVLHLGVDLIQGFVTSGPAFSFRDSIAEEVRKIIVDENIKISANTNRKVYVASSNKDLSLVALALEDYTAINVSCSELAIHGNLDYTAEMHIKIKEGTNCHMTIENVKLDSDDEMPCIDIEEGATLTLHLEGDNVLNTKGIHVPEGSKLTVTGSGNLLISAKGQNCYGIGSGQDETVGTMVFENSGGIEVRVDGDHCIAIGGGIYRFGEGIDIRSGGYSIQTAGVDVIGIGCVQGQMPIHMMNFAMEMIIRANLGCGIGSLNGLQDIECKNFNLNIDGSGSMLCAMGSIATSGGTIDLSSGTFDAKLNGQMITMIGVKQGDIKVNTEHIRLEIVGEGDDVLGIGSRDFSGKVDLEDTNIEMVINAATPNAFGSQEEDVIINAPGYNIRVNGEGVKYARKPQTTGDI